MPLLDNYLLSNYNSLGVKVANYKKQTKNDSGISSLNGGDERNIYTLAEFPAGTKSISFFNNTTVPNYVQTWSAIGLALSDGINNVYITPLNYSMSYATTTFISFYADLKALVSYSISSRQASGPSSITGIPVEFNSVSLNALDLSKPLKLVIRARNTNPSASDIYIRFTSCDIVSI